MRYSHALLLAEIWYEGPLKELNNFGVISCLHPISIFLTIQFHRKSKFFPAFLLTVRRPMSSCFLSPTRITQISANFPSSFREVIFLSLGGVPFSAEMRCLWSTTSFPFTFFQLDFLIFCPSLPQPLWVWEEAVKKSTPFPLLLFLSLTRSLLPVQTFEKEAHTVSPGTFVARWNWQSYDIGFISKVPNFYRHFLCKIFLQ